MIVIDDFIQDPVLLNDIQNDKDFFANNGSYYWWDGWWNSTPDTPKKRLMKHIWLDHCPYPFRIPLSGFEYWTGQYDPETPVKHLGMHLDKDEALFSEKGDLSHPVIGTVFYPYEMDIDGGFLEIFSNGVDCPPERIEAKFNRLVIFNAGTHHHQVTEVTRGTRYAIAINLWDEKPTGKLLSE